jgi:uncharacterized SAM-dependent methyltransferase
VRSGRIRHAPPSPAAAAAAPERDGRQAAASVASASPASHHDLRFARAVFAGLQAVPKAIASEWLADEVERGFDGMRAAGFDDDATRVETLILGRCAREIAAEVGAGARVAIWGGDGGDSGVDSLFAALDRPQVGTPIDASAFAPGASTQGLNGRFPKASKPPVAGEGMRRAALPASLMSSACERRILVALPARRTGATAPRDVAALLRRLASKACPRTRLVVGTPLLPHPSLPIDAGNDRVGIAPGPGLRLLARVNRELGGDFDQDGHREELRFDAMGRCCDRVLVSRKAQRVRVLGRLFEFGAGESIHLGRTHLYGLAQFEAMAEAAGWHLRQRWTDGGARCAVHVLAPRPSR